MKSQVYLAGAMALVSNEHASEWRDQAHTLLHGYGFVVANPVVLDQESDAGRVNLDKAIIAASQALLVDGRQPGWGTAMEVMFAHSLHKLIVVWGVDHEEAPSWLRHHATIVARPIEDACLHLWQLARYTDEAHP